MTARAVLLSTLSTLDECLLLPELIDQAPSEALHNRRAAMLRQGQAVLLFSAMETFIRDRTAEILQSFNAGVVTFASLSDKLQSAVTLGALEGIQNRVRAQDKQLQAAWVMTEVAAISSASVSLANLSRYSFAHSKSNIGEEDVSNILGAFGVDSAWDSIAQITGRSGAGLPSAKTEFIAIKKRRHASAHVVTGAVPHADLKQSLLSVRAICAAFDLLMSTACRAINQGAFPGVATNPKLRGAGVSLIFVQPRARKFVVLKEQLPPPAPAISRLTVRVFDDEATARTFGAGYALSRGSSLVIRDASGMPKDWSS